MKRKSIALAIVAVVLVLGMSIGNVWSYFTDTTTVQGSIPVRVEPTTHLFEENGPGTKAITIENTGEDTSVWVRARVYAPTKLGADASGENWTGNITDWFYYGEPLLPGDVDEALKTTKPLKVTFNLPKGYDIENNIDGAHNGDEVNVVVLYQTLPVSYDAAGNPVPADWND